MKTAIIGLGLIGGSAALELKASKFASYLYGVESSPEHQKLAKKLGLVDEITSLENAVTKADLVIIATPVDQIIALLPQVLDFIRPETTVTDMGSTKELICECIKSHPKKRQFIASHPMAGTEFSGPTAAQRSLFKNKVAVICNAEQAEAQHLNKVTALYTALGMRITTLAADDHDTRVAFVSHLSHLSSFMLANTVLDEEKNTHLIFDLASGGFESTVRLAKSSPDMWVPILEQNTKNVARALESYIAHLQEFHKSLITHDTRKTHALMTRGNEIIPILNQINNTTRQEK